MRIPEVRREIVRPRFANRRLSACEVATTFAACSRGNVMCPLA